MSREPPAGVPARPDATDRRAHPDVEVELAPDRRVRSPGDVLRLLVGLVWLFVGLAAVIFAERTIGGLEADLVEGFTRLPDRVEQAVIGLGQVVAIAVTVGVVGMLVVQRQFARLAVLVGAALGAAAAMRVIGALLTRDLIAAPVDPGVSTGWIFDPGFPSSPYVASTAAVVTLASVYLSRRWKRAAWGAVAALVLLRVLASSEPALDVLLAIAVGVVVASLLLVVFGAPSAEPTPGVLVAAIVALCPELSAVRPGPGGGATRTYEAEAGDQRLFVKLRTVDDRSADLLNRLWRAARLRSGEVERPYATVQRRVEHEALLVALAARGGARSPELVGLSTTPDGAAVLVEELVPGRSLDAWPADQIDDELLGELWAQLDALHESRIAHRSLHLANVVVDDHDRPWIVDFDDARASAPPRQLARDVAQLLVDLALTVGPARAVAPAVERLGSERVAAALPLLQPLALPVPTRRELRGRKELLEELRHEICSRTGARDVEPERLERIRPRTLVTIVASAAAFYFLLPQLANIEQTVDAFTAADWWWMPVILGAAGLTFAFAAVSFLGSVPDRVPFFAALRAQVAAAFAGLVAPARVGGIAIGLRFLQRSGVDGAVATAAVSVNQVAGVVAHLGLLALFVSWTGRSEVGGFSVPASTTVVVTAAIVIGASALALLLRPVRRRLLDPVVQGARSAGAALAAVFTSPGRVAALFGGSIGITLAFILALVASVEAFGGGLSVPQIGAAYLAAAAIGAAAPTPGGLGAVEAALVAALTGFGLADGAAVSAVLTFRLATYWLPIVPGWVTFGWMQRRGEL